MQRPNFISDKDIVRWDHELNIDPIIPQDLVANLLVREVCYASMWLTEELQKIGCIHSLITDMQFSAGKASFGNNTWEVHQKFLVNYKNNAKFADTTKILN